MTSIYPAAQPASPAATVVEIDPAFEALHEEARALADAEPVLRRLVTDTILTATSLPDALARRVSARLGNEDVPAQALYDAFAQALSEDGKIASYIRADHAAVVERDPAVARPIEPVLYFKGFHALEAHRFAHFLWQRGRTDLALYLQSRSSSVFAVDIHPQVPVGSGVFIDHATGVVIGATAVIEDDVSILQGVTLGGTGKERGDRHPKIRRGVLIGAGAKILGNIEIGRCARVASGSVVLHDVPPATTVAGVPARIVGKAGCDEPARAMDQLIVDDPVI